MNRPSRVCVLLAALLGLMVIPAQAQAVDVPGINCGSVGGILGKAVTGGAGIIGQTGSSDAPTPDMPGQGISAIFGGTPTPLPKTQDPFAKGSTTTIYEQYGFSGLRWHTYDLGCGPDATRDPSAVMGTTLANWIIDVPIAVCALTAAVTRAAFHPTFLQVFNPTIRHISQSLHESIFAPLIPLLLVVLGVGIMFKARRSALATSTAAVGWAMLVILIATALFRWPVQSGNFADNTVVSTLGRVVNRIDGHLHADPSLAVASNVQESILYHSWLAGTLGATDTATARKYGPLLFKAQALTWQEARTVETDPTNKGKAIIDSKKQQWDTLAGQIKDADPNAYENLQGKRSDTRMAYSVLSLVATVLALPFLLMSSLLLLGSFLVIRLAVMMFPAFAVLGIFPAGRPLVIGVGRTVGAALVNSLVFGIGATITIWVLGILLDPASKLPMWLSLVMMPLFSFVMWVALRPFRRLTTMIHRQDDPFREMAGSLGAGARSAGKLVKSATVTAAGVYVGGVGAAATAKAAASPEEPPVRAESHPTSEQPYEPVPLQIEDGYTDVAPEIDPELAQAPEPEVVEPEQVDGEEVYPIYRPDADVA